MWHNTQMNKIKVKKTMTGTVVSDKMTNTAIVEIEIWKVHPIIKKRYKRHSRYMAENPGNKYKNGDRVKISETKPISLNKRWIIMSLVKKKDVS